MIRLLSSNIISPLAYNTGENYRAVKSGKSAIAQYCNWNGIPDTFAGSMFTPQHDWKEETICQDDKKRRQCSKCKAAMRKISDKKGGIDFSKLPKIVCKECGDNFKIYEHIFFWD